MEDFPAIIIWIIIELLGIMCALGYSFASFFKMRYVKGTQQRYALASWSALFRWPGTLGTFMMALRGFVTGYYFHGIIATIALTLIIQQSRRNENDDDDNFFKDLKNSLKNYVKNMAPKPLLKPIRVDST